MEQIELSGQKGTTRAMDQRYGSEDLVERRRRFRTAYLAFVKLRVDQYPEMSGSLKNIAADSCFVQIDAREREKLEIGTNVNISISIMRGKSSMVIGCAGNVARVAADGVAIQLEEQLCWWPLFSLFPVNDQFFLDVVRQTV